MRLRPDTSDDPRAACKRFDCTAYYQAALPAIEADPRACALPLARKLQLIDSAINALIDGYRRPKWINAVDEAWPGNTFLPRLWDIALEQVRTVPFPQPLLPLKGAK